MGTSRNRLPAALCRIPLALLFLALLVPITPPAPVAAQATAEAVASVEGITEYRLDNGLRVLLFPDQSKPQTTVNITYLVGSRHEAYGETGMAHLLEHLVFMGTPDHPDIKQELTERGARPNGTTWYDRTNYFETFPASEENLEWALDLEADRMVNSFISEEDLRSEMTVVRNEMESGENNPIRVLLERVMSTAYLWHNYGKSTIGARADVENVPIERLQGFYRKYYQPDNAILVVAGKFDEDHALRVIEEKFGAIPRPDRSGEMKIWPTYTAEPTQDGERMVTLRRNGDQQLVMMMWHVPSGAHEDYAALDVLTHVLGNEPSGRLYEALVETKLASSAQALSFQLKEAGPFGVFASVRPQDDLDRAWQVMDETIEGLLENPPTDEEVNRAKTAKLKNIELAMNNTTGIALGLSEWASMGDWRLFFLHRDRLEAVEPADVERVARSYLKPSNRTVGLFHPTEEPDRAVVPAAPDVDALVADYQGREVVAEGEAFDPTPENVEARVMRFELSNGVEVALLPKQNRGGEVTGSLNLYWGDEESLMNRSTAASIAGSMLMRGTTNLTRQQLTDSLDALKSRLSVGGSVSSGSASLQTTNENLVPTLRLMGEILRQPAFDPAEFEILKEEQIAGIEAQLSEPTFKAIEALQTHLNTVPKGHPRYSETMEESIASLEAVTLEEAKVFYEEFYGPQNAKVVLIGSFDVDEVRAVLEEEMGTWESPHPFTRLAGELYTGEPGDIVIETPDKANAFFIAMQPMPLSESHPDHPAMALAGQMIGGGFLNSRLAERIRNQDGLSYGVGGGIQAHPLDEVGAFVAQAIYAPENREALEAAFREEIQKVIDEGFTAEEMEAARVGYLESLHLSRSNDRSLAATLSQHLYWDRNMTYDRAFADAIRALTLEEVNAAVARHLDLSGMTLIRAGDFAGAEDVPIGL